MNVISKEPERATRNFKINTEISRQHILSL